MAELISDPVRPWKPENAGKKTSWGVRAKEKQEGKTGLSIKSLIMVE